MTFTLNLPLLTIRIPDLVAGANGTSGTPTAGNGGASPDSYGAAIANPFAAVASPINTSLWQGGAAKPVQFDLHDPYTRLLFLASAKGFKVDAKAIDADGDGKASPNEVSDYLKTSGIDFDALWNALYEKNHKMANLARAYERLAKAQAERAAGEFVLLGSELMDIVTTAADARVKTPVIEFEAGDSGAGFLFAAMTEALGVDSASIDTDLDGRISSQEVFSYFEKSGLDFKALGDRLVQQDPDAARIAYSYNAYNDAKAKWAKGDKAGAREFLSAAVNLNPMNVPALKALGLMEIRDEETAASGAMRLAGISKAGYQDAESLEALADYFAAKGDYKNAVRTGLQRNRMGFAVYPFQTVDHEKRCAFEVKLSGWARESGDIEQAYAILRPNNLPYASAQSVEKKRVEAMMALGSDQAAWVAAGDKKMAEGDFEAAYRIYKKAQEITRKEYVRRPNGDIVRRDRVRVDISHNWDNQDDSVKAAKADVDAKIAVVQAKMGEAKKAYDAMLAPTDASSLPKEIQGEVKGLVIQGLEARGKDVQAKVQKWMDEKGVKLPKALLDKIEEAQKTMTAGAGAEAVQAAADLQRYEAAAAGTIFLAYLQETGKRDDVNALIPDTKFMIVRGAIVADEGLVAEGLDRLGVIEESVLTAEPLLQDAKASVGGLWPEGTPFRYVTDFTDANKDLTGHTFGSYEPTKDFLTKLPVVTTYINLEDGELKEKIGTVLQYLRGDKFGNPYHDGTSSTWTLGNITTIEGLKARNETIQTVYGGDHIKTFLAKVEGDRRTEALKENKSYQSHLDLQDALSDLRDLSLVLEVKDASTVTVADIDTTREKHLLNDTGARLVRHLETELKKAEDEVLKDRKAYGSLVSADVSRIVMSWGAEKVDGLMSYAYQKDIHDASNAVGKLPTRYDQLMAMSDKDREDAVGFMESERLKSNARDMKKINEDLTAVRADVKTLKDLKVTEGNKAQALKTVQDVAGRFFQLEEMEVRAGIDSELGVAADLHAKIDFTKLNVTSKGVDFAQRDRDARFGIQKCYVPVFDPWEAYSTRPIYSAYQALKPLDADKVDGKSAGKRVAEYQKILGDLSTSMSYGSVAARITMMKELLPSMKAGDGGMNHIISVGNKMAEGIDWIAGYDHVDASYSTYYGDRAQEVITKLEAIQKKFDSGDPKLVAEAKSELVQFEQAPIMEEIRDLAGEAAGWGIVDEAVSIVAAGAVAEIVATVVTGGLALVAEGAYAAYRGYRVVKGLEIAFEGQQAISRAAKIARATTHAVAMGTAFTFAEPVFSGVMRNGGWFSGDAWKKSWNDNLDNIQKNPQAFIWQAGVNSLMFPVIERSKILFGKGYDYFLERAAVKSLGGRAAMRVAAKDALLARGVLQKSVTSAMVDKEAERLLTHELTFRGMAHQSSRGFVQFLGEVATFQGWNFTTDVAGQAGQAIRGERDGIDVVGAAKKHLFSLHAWKEGFKTLVAIKVVGSLGGALHLDGRDGAELKYFENGREITGRELNERIKNWEKGLDAAKVDDPAYRQQVLNESEQLLKEKKALLEQVPDLLRDATYWETYHATEAAIVSVGAVRGADASFASALAAKPETYGLKPVGKGIYLYSGRKAPAFLENAMRAGNDGSTGFKVLSTWTNGLVVAEVTGADGQTSVIRFVPDAAISKLTVAQAFKAAKTPKPALESKGYGSDRNTFVAKKGAKTAENDTDVQGVAMAARANPTEAPEKISDEPKITDVADLNPTNVGDNAAAALTFMGSFLELPGVKFESVADGVVSVKDNAQKDTLIKDMSRRARFRGLRFDAVDGVEGAYQVSYKNNVAPTKFTIKVVVRDDGEAPANDNAAPVDAPKPGATDGTNAGTPNAKKVVNQ